MSFVLRALYPSGAVPAATDMNSLAHRATASRQDCQLSLRRTPHPVIVTIRDNKDHISVLLYSSYTTITGWGVLLNYHDHRPRVPSSDDGSKSCSYLQTCLRKRCTTNARFLLFGVLNPQHYCSFNLIFPCLFHLIRHHWPLLQIENVVEHPPRIRQ